MISWSVSRKEKRRTEAGHTGFKEMSFTWYESAVLFFLSWGSPYDPVCVCGQRLVKFRSRSLNMCDTDVQYSGHPHKKQCIYYIYQAHEKSRTWDLIWPGSFNYIVTITCIVVNFTASYVFSLFRNLPVRTKSASKFIKGPCDFFCTNDLSCQLQKIQTSERSLLSIFTK